MIAAARSALAGPGSKAVAERLDAALQGQRPADYQRQMGWVLIALQNAFYWLGSGAPLEDAVVGTVARAATATPTPRSSGRCSARRRARRRSRRNGATRSGPASPARAPVSRGPRPTSPTTPRRWLRRCSGWRAQAAA